MCCDCDSNIAFPVSNINTTIENYRDGSINYLSLTLPSLQGT